MSKRLVGGIIGYKHKISSWHSNGFPDGSNMGQQYNTGEKPTVMLYTYINRHAETTPDKNDFFPHNRGMLRRSRCGLIFL